MNATGLDRRILRAFYTQYIAVLLIVLVFFVAAFQRSQTDSPVETAYPELIAQESSVIRPLEIRAFSDDGVILLNSHELDAIAEVLRSHDLRAEVAVFVKHYDFDATQGEVSGGLRRARLVEDFFRHRGVPAGIVGVVVEESTVSAAEVVRVRMTKEGVIHGAL